MPFESKAQMRYMYSQHPKIAKRWSMHTPNEKGLPEKIGKALDGAYKRRKTKKR